MRHEPDYIDKKIATVRNHRDADNCWPQWANIFADTIEDYRAELDACRRDLAEERARTTRLTERLQDIAGRAWRDEGGRIAAAVARDGIADERGAGTEQPA